MLCMFESFFYDMSYAIEQVLNGKFIVDNDHAIIS